MGLRDFAHTHVRFRTRGSYDCSVLEKGEGKMIIGQQGAKRDGVREQRIAKVVELTPPGKVIDELPLGEARTKAVIRGRQEVVDAHQRALHRWP